MTKSTTKVAAQNYSNVNRIRYYVAQCVTYLYIWVHTIGAGVFNTQQAYIHYCYFIKYYVGANYTLSRADCYRWLEWLHVDVDAKNQELTAPGIYPADTLANVLNAISTKKRLKGYKNDTVKKLIPRRAERSTVGGRKAKPKDGSVKSDNGKRSATAVKK